MILCSTDNSKFIDFCKLQLGRVDLAEENSEEAELREDLVTKHYSRRVTELTSNLQLADSKAVHFYAEVKEFLKMSLKSVAFVFTNVEFVCNLQA